MQGELLRQRDVTRFRGREGDLRVSRPTVVVVERAALRPCDCAVQARAGPEPRGAGRSVASCAPSVSEWSSGAWYTRSHESVIIPTRTPLLGPRLRMLCGFVMEQRAGSGRGGGADCSSSRIIATIARDLGSGGRALSRCGAPRWIADVTSNTSNPVSRPCGC